MDPDQDLDEELDQVEPIAPVSDPVGTARRRHGAAGAMLAAGMLGIDQVLGRKPREDAPIIVDAPSEPIDLDKDGIRVPVDELTDVVAPPLPRSEPVEGNRRKGHRR